MHRAVKLHKKSCNVFYPFYVRFFVIVLHTLSIFTDCMVYFVTCDIKYQSINQSINPKHNALGSIYRMSDDIQIKLECKRV